MNPMRAVVGIIGSLIIILLAAYCHDLVKFRRHELSDEKEIYSERATQGKFWHIISSDEARTGFMEMYGIELPDNDFNKNYLLISDGRKILGLGYRAISQYLWHYDFPKGIARFGKKHFPHTVFVYKTSRIYIHPPAD